MKKTHGAHKALPERPNLDHLKNQAHTLLQAAQAGAVEALRRVAQSHPRFAGGQVEGAALALSDAQLVIAREYGFRSWPKLRSHVLRLGSDAPTAAKPADIDSACEGIRERLRRLGRVDGSVSIRDLKRIEGPLEVGALIALAAGYCERDARQALVAAGDPSAVVTALDAVIGMRKPEPVGAGVVAGEAGALDACLAVLYCGGFPHLLGRRFALTRGRMTLGRNLERDVAFNDDAVSRLHCTIEHRDGRFVLRDERSTNGTFVASAGAFVNQAPEPVTEHVLVDGDQFAIGDVILAFLALEADAGESPAERQLRLEAKYRAAVDYIASHDALTRLYNRRAFDGELHRAVLFARGADRPLSALLLDVDELDQCNESLGGLAGNGLLLRVAQVLREELGETAIVGRYGGDEYAVLLPGVALAEALTVAERLRAAVQLRPLELAGKQIRATVSAGVATLYRTTGAEELLDDARAALGAAKEAGRNTVRAAA